VPSRLSGLVFGPLIRLLWQADRRMVVWVAGITLSLGLLPNLIVLATGNVVKVTTAPDQTSAWSRHALAALAVLGLAFAAMGVLVAVARWATELLTTSYVDRVFTDVGHSWLSTRFLSSVEDAEFTSVLGAAREFERSGLYMQAVPGLRMVVSRRISGFGAAALLFPLAWWAPFVLGIGWWAVGWGSGRWMERGFGAAEKAGGGGLRRADYFRALAVRGRAAKEVRIFGLAQWIGAEYASTWLTAMRTVWSIRRAMARDLVLAVAALLASHAVVFAFLASEAASGRIGLGRLVVYGMAVLGTADLGFLGDVHWRAARASAMAGQLQTLTRHARAATRGPHALPAPDRAERHEGAVSVSLKGVGFGYGTGDQKVLQGLDLDIPAGQSIAIVGENGAGKSTLLKLLCGLYAADDGVVRLDGEDVRRIPPDRMHERVGIIFQDFLHYELPMRENVGFGGLPLLGDDVALLGALRDAGGESLLTALPAGLETILAQGYDGGVDLSGGQWQHVALARALLAVRGGAGLLILDEPTSALDVRAEVEIFDRFLSVTRDVTTVLVSHRLSGVRRADRIVLLEDGRITEDGTHDDLMAANGHYAHMFHLQADRFFSAESSTGSGTDA
jgi:ATP-binding cassette subfamily B protein